jgi:hypothetical protein
MGREWRDLKAAAPELDARLRSTPFRTLTHGDFKTENLLFGSTANRGSSAGGKGGLCCAAYDFQYIGGGSGMKDVVYLLVSGTQPRLLAQQEQALLQHYHEQLMAGLQAAADGGGAEGVVDRDAAARAAQQYSFEAMLGDYKLSVCDYVRFMAGWGFWGNASWAATQARQYLEELGLGA